MLSISMSRIGRWPSCLSFLSSCGAPQPCFRVGEIHPIALPSGLQPGRSQLLLGPIGSRSRGWRSSSGSSPGRSPLKSVRKKPSPLPRKQLSSPPSLEDLQPQVLDVEVSGPGHAGDVQGDVIHDPWLERCCLRPGLPGPARGMHAQGRPESHQSGSELAAGQQAPLEVLNQAFRRCRVA